MAFRGFNTSSAVLAHTHSRTLNEAAHQNGTSEMSKTNVSLSKIYEAKCENEQEKQKKKFEAIYRQALAVCEREGLKVNLPPPNFEVVRDQKIETPKKIASVGYRLTREELLEEDRKRTLYNTDNHGVTIILGKSLHRQAKSWEEAIHRARRDKITRASIIIQLPPARVEVATPVQPPPPTVGCAWALEGADCRDGELCPMYLAGIAYDNKAANSEFFTVREEAQTAPTMAAVRQPEAPARMVTQELQATPQVTAGEVQSQPMNIQARQSSLADNRRRKKVMAALFSDRKKLEVLRKTQMCQNILRDGECLYGEKCSFAHTTEELKPATCKHGVRCRFVRKIADGWENVEGGMCNFLHPQETRSMFNARMNLQDPP